MTAKQYEIGSQLLLITNRKSHTLSNGTDLDDLERRNSPYFAFFHGIRYADYVTVVRL